MTKKLLAISFTIILCMTLLEAGLRLIGRRPTNMADGIAEQHGDSFRLKKNVKKTMKFPAFSYTVFTNEYGFRDNVTGEKELEEKPFAAFLGASDVFGNGVEYEDSFVGIFAEEARKKGMEVLNLAVGGHYFLDQESVLKEFMADTGLKPSVILFCANALHIPKFDMRNENIIVRSGYVMGRGRWRLAYLRLMAGNLSSSFCFFRDAIRRIQEKWFDFEASSESPEFFEIYSKSSKIRDPQRIQAFEEYLGSFEAFCMEKGISLIYVYLPLSDSFKLADMLRQVGEDPRGYDTSFYEQLMSSYCDKKGLKMVNLKPLLQRYADEGHELRFKLDPHFNAFANRLIGDFLVKEIL